MSFNLKHKDVMIESMDGCSTNTNKINPLEDHQDVKWMTSLCFSHCGNNAGHEAGFPILDRFWTILQKNFSYSGKAKNNSSAKEATVAYSRPCRSQNRILSKRGHPCRRVEPQREHRLRIEVAEKLAQQKLDDDLENQQQEAAFDR
jgi:hypothetical protein